MVHLNLTFDVIYIFNIARENSANQFGKQMHGRKQTDGIFVGMLTIWFWLWEKQRSQSTGYTRVRIRLHVHTTYERRRRYIICHFTKRKTRRTLIKSCWCQATSRKIAYMWTIYMCCNCNTQHANISHSFCDGNERYATRKCNRASIAFVFSFASW